MAKVIGITLGDPTGIGPELIAKTIGRGAYRIYGDRGVLARAAKLVGVALPDVEIVELTKLPGTIVQGSSEAGAAQVAYLEAAIAAARAGEIAALVTAPIHKAACIAAGFAFPGHTELLAARLSPDDEPLAVTMMLAGPRLRVALATTHIALADVPRALKDGAPITRAIVQSVQALRDRFGIATPRIAVAGLNPHAGEHGHFGDEELRIVVPAIERARAIEPAAIIDGPHVPDAVFRDAVDGTWDAVVALYHDQGLIPVKLVDFDEAVNVTLGLPILRTSPDHGVAYDIAGTGRARPTSFAAALRIAERSLRDDA